MLQSSSFDGVAFDPFALEQDCLAASEVDIGNSTLRIDVVRKPDQNEYARAILVDTMVHYSIPDAVERYVTRPAILRAFGCDVEQVLGKDWVMRQLGSQQTRSRRA